MSKTLLNFGAVINLLFGAFHIWLVKIIQASDSFARAPEMRPLMLVLNISTALLILLFAYASFFCKKDLLTTKLGKSILVLTALFYLLRAVEEIIFFKFSFVIFTPCTLIGAMYVAILFLPYHEEDYSPVKADE
jgi:hypothetical protein